MLLMQSIYSLSETSQSFFGLRLPDIIYTHYPIWFNSPTIKEFGVLNFNRICLAALPPLTIHIDWTCKLDSLLWKNYCWYAANGATNSKYAYILDGLNSFHQIIGVRKSINRDADGDFSILIVQEGIRPAQWLAMFFSILNSVIYPSGKSGKTTHICLI